MKNVILLHGLNTNPTEKWYPWFADGAQQLGWQCLVPTLPHADDPQISEWIGELDRLRPDKNTTLIGHSRGGVAILRWLEAQPESLRVQKVILVAANSGFVQKMAIPTETNHGFYTEQGYDFEKIKQHCAEFIVLHSKDDQWVLYEAGVENADGLGARLITFEDRGHFGKGVSEIPELLKEFV